MRLEHKHDHRTRTSTNGSSQNGSSPTTHHANGTSGKHAAAEMETNGFHTNGHSAEPVEQDHTPFFGHDREEVTRILLQSLSDLGYHQAAKQLSSESGYQLEVPPAAAFKNAVLRGHWEEAEGILFGQDELDGGVVLGNGYAERASWRTSRTSFGSQNGTGRHGLPLAAGADLKNLKFLLRQQKYLELLENRDLNAALAVLRNELAPMRKDTVRLHRLSSLIMCQSSEDLRSQAEWDGAQGESRRQLLSEISRSISPSIMIPEHRLATLFESVQQAQILDCQFHNTLEQPSLYTQHECSPDDFPLTMQTELRKHEDEVWFLEFSHDGSMLATAGKDGLVCIYDTERWKIRHEFREHEQIGQTNPHRGVCYVAFSPNDQYLISCSQNNEFVVMDLETGRLVAKADDFDYPVTTAAWLPDSQHFVIGTQGSKKPLGLYGLRSATGSSGVTKNNEIHNWRDPPFDPSSKDHSNSFRITDCAVSRDGSRMVATTIHNQIMMYDLRTKYKIAEWQMDDKLTSINFSQDGTEMLVNMNEGRLFALDSETCEVKMRYDGVVQKNFVIRSSYGGAGEGFVISGSEDSRVYIWRRQTGMQVAALEAHTAGTVNAVAWHPTNPAMFASAGDDRNVRIWAPANVVGRPTTPGSVRPGASTTSLGVYQSPYGSR